MLSSISLALLLSAGQYPDELDVFRTDPRANVLFLLDSSCSMGPAWGTLPTACTWYGGRYNGGSTHFSKNQMMLASLVGCTSETDGILDRWADRLNISVWHFGNSVGELAAFGASKSTLESAVLSVPASGGTPMTLGLRGAGNAIRTAFNDANHPSCRKDYVVMMSDGEPNGGGATFDYECTAPVENLWVSSTQPWVGARYLFQEPNPPTTPRDLLCSVSGTQPIRTYSIGFEALAGFDETSLMNIARDGDGAYFHATSITELSRSFESILSNIVARSRVDFSATTAQTAGLFADNFAYSAYFKPGVGAWTGNVKKFCVEPRRLSTGRYDTSQTGCMFTSPDGQSLTTNPAPQDQWTLSTSGNADAGGAGAVIFSQLGAGPGAAPVAPYWTRRRILTWLDGTGYVAVTPSVISSAVSGASGCEHYRFLNYLHGYTWEADCGTGNPLAVRAWPLGSAIHASPVLLKYGACNDAGGNPVAGRCYVAQAMNDGMLHLFDAATGQETSALVPSELWVASVAARSRLHQLNDQPTPERMQRYFVDGELRLYHDDLDGDLVIEPGETARLIVGLGRGGDAYYQIDVTRLSGGQLSTADNPVYPLVRTEGTAFGELRETWHAPFVGRLQLAGARRKIVAFGSGHVAELDAAEAPLREGLSGPPVLVPGREQNVACAGPRHFADYNGYVSTGGTSCQVAYDANCRGTRAKPCYDTGYWSTDPAAALPLLLQMGPFRWRTPGERAVGFQVHFNHFDLGPGDEVRIKDGRGAVLLRYSGTQLDNGGSTDWFWDWDDLGFHIEIATNGVDSDNKGVEIANVRYRAVPDPLPPGPPAHNPTLFVLDADKWNGESPRAFAAPAAGAAVLRVSRSCAASDSGTCLDAAQVPALARLSCPITAEVSAYTEGDLVKALYFATECGEIWKTWTTDDGRNWSARRLLSLNTPDGTGDSKDFRKIFRRLDVVGSACPGRRLVALYFGTGDVQRPQAQNALGDASLNSGRDVVGVLWDDGAIDDLGVSALANITNASPGSVEAPSLYAAGKRGWYLELGPQERMLRNPLVFDNVAYFKTRQPTSGSSECAAGAGTDRVYAVSSCTGDPLGDVNADGLRDTRDRERWVGASDIGSELFLFVPRAGAPIVSAGDHQTTTSARLNPTRGREVARFYMWRRPWRDR